MINIESRCIVFKKSPICVYTPRPICELMYDSVGASHTRHIGSVSLYIYIQPDRASHIAQSHTKLVSIYWIIKTPTLTTMSEVLIRGMLCYLGILLVTCDRVDMQTSGEKSMVSAKYDHSYYVARLAAGRLRKSIVTLFRYTLTE